MTKLACRLAVVLIAFPPALSIAQEDIRDGRKKAITYLGIGYRADLAIPPHHLATIEQNIRNQIELPRFEYIAVAPGEFLP